MSHQRQKQTVLHTTVRKRIELDDYPDSSYLRFNQIIPDVLPIGMSTLHAWIADGTFPKPKKLGSRVSAFLVRDVREYLNKVNESANE